MSSDNKKNKKENFEDSLNNLEAIVSQLEKGELPLDESITKFEQGISMYNECKDFLSTAENKIKVLTDSLKEEELDS
jgi:exodeoxyribonuclease VII small subunit